MDLVKLTEPLVLFCRELTLRFCATGSPVDFPPGLVPSFFLGVQRSSVASWWQLMLPYLFRVFAKDGSHLTLVIHNRVRKNLLTTH